MNFLYILNRQTGGVGLLVVTSMWGWVWEGGGGIAGGGGGSDPDWLDDRMME